jgi:predicted transcriptional regulator YheO
VEAIDRRETLRTIAENLEIVLHLLSKRSIAVRIANDRRNPSESSKPSEPAIDRSEHCERSLNPRRLC